jgi:hypothetical protein
MFAYNNAKNAPVSSSVATKVKECMVREVIFVFWMP